MRINFFGFFAFFLCLLIYIPLSSQAAAIQTDTTIFNITSVASGFGNITSGTTTFSVVIGEPLVGNVSTENTGFRFGFFSSRQEYVDFVANPNNPPTLPIWIYPQNNTVILDNNIVPLQFSSVDPDGDTITYYIYQNDTYLRTSNYNVSVILENGTYTFTVAAYDGNKFSGNASTTFAVDVPVVNNIDWPVAVALFYLVSVGFYVFFGFTIKDKQFREMVTQNGFVTREVTDGFLTGLKALYLLSMPALILLGMHIGTEVALYFGAPSSITDSMVRAFQVFMYLYIFTLVIFVIILIRNALGYFYDITAISTKGFNFKRKPRGGGKGGF